MSERTPKEDSAPPPSEHTPEHDREVGERPSLLKTARDLLSTDFYLRHWGKFGLRDRSVEVDEFGFDPTYEARVRPALDFLYEKYWRVDARDADRVPSEGGCLIVANHSGTLPYDGVMIGTALRLRHANRREVRWLLEDFVFHFPFLGAFMTRIGGVRACQENAERLLRKEAAVVTFPEGYKGIGKLYRERYRLQRFGRGGYVKLALRTGVPIVPVAVVGAEEVHPTLLRLDYLAKILALPYLPVTPTFPWLGPLGLVPLPTKWTIAFGEPIRFDREKPGAADDAVRVAQLNDDVRERIQQMLDAIVGERQSVFFG